MLLCFLDEGSVATEEGGDTESLLGDGVGVVFNEGVVHEEVDILRRERSAHEVFAEAGNTETTAGDTKLGVVGGDEGEGVAGNKYVGESLHDGLALDGVGGASRLVDKYEEPFLGAELHHFGDFYYFGGKRGEAVHLVLLVAYAEDDVVDEGDGGGLGRDIHAELCEELRYAEGFQENGLTRHIGASDEAEARMDDDVDGLVAQTMLLIAMEKTRIEESFVLRECLIA